MDGQQIVRPFRCLVSPNSQKSFPLVFAVPRGVDGAGSNLIESVSVSSKVLSKKFVFEFKFLAIANLLPTCVSFAFTLILAI
jgi:hypothetical protein